MQHRSMAKFQPIRALSQLCYSRNFKLCYGFFYCLQLLIGAPYVYINIIEWLIAERKLVQARAIPLTINMYIL